METVITYRTSDGEEYADKTEAERHEVWLEKRAAFRRLPWVDRHLARLRAQLLSFDKIESLVERLNATADAADQMMRKSAGDVLNIPAEWLKQLADTLQTIHTTTYFRYLKRSTQEEILRTIDYVETHREDIEQANEDIDGTCAFLRDRQWKCAQPTVEGTRWCAEHVDCWSRSDGTRHIVGSDYDGTPIAQPAVASSDGRDQRHETKE